MNKPFNHKQVKQLERGFTPTTTFLGTVPERQANGTIKMVERYYPNRKQRRAGLQKQNNKPAFGKMVLRVQVATEFRDNDGKRIKERDLFDYGITQKPYTHRYKRIYHTVKN